VATPAYRRPSKRSWAGGLYDRLLALGLDPYTAKMVARHVRRDFVPWAKAFAERAHDPQDVALFSTLILGLDEKD